MSLDILSSPVTDWICSSLGTQTKISSIKKLPGSTSSDLYRLELIEGSRACKLVLRLLTNAKWLVDEPDLAEHEAAALTLAHQSRLAVPEIVAWDSDGRQCGIPAVLMTHVPGEVNLLPVDFDSWLRQMAEVLSPIHAVDVTGYRWTYYPYYDPQKLKPPSWAKNSLNWERAIVLVNQPPPDIPTTFIHRDYHPMNTLWKGQVLSGIVDWVNACRGPAAFDLAWNRLNLMLMYGVEIADRLRDLAVEIDQKSWHPYWDLTALMHLLPGPPEIYPPWPEFGLQGLTVPLLINRAEEYLASLLIHFTEI